MNIKGIGSVSNINYYSKISLNKTEKVENIKSSDRIEISEAGKTLKNYGVEISSYDNTNKIIEIKNKLSNGTYNIDAKLTAKSMLDQMKGIE